MLLPREVGSADAVLCYRKANESVVIGGQGALGRVVRVTVMEIGDDFVRLALEANDDVAVDCQESGASALSTIAELVHRLGHDVNARRDQGRMRHRVLRRTPNRPATRRLTRDRLMTGNRVDCMRNLGTWFRQVREGD